MTSPMVIDGFDEVGVVLEASHLVVVAPLGGSEKGEALPFKDAAALNSLA